MDWIPLDWVLIIEATVLMIVLGLLIETVVTNSKKLQMVAQEMCTSSEKVELLLQKIDHEFELINNCAKLIKIVFLSVGKFYKEIAAGSTTIEEAVREAKNNIPDDLKSDMSSLFNLSLDETVSNLEQQQRSGMFNDIEPAKTSLQTMPYFKVCQPAKSFLDVRTLK